ncbi:hypothetical protein IT084_13735 [Desulfallas sp. Bu1-1]|jgi:hypothetical protein|uniref:hypothetical protein n=1 Tax=Desulfallas sp. Bu1-1 TaxID=2787620 RepID=UPI0018A100CE|nr:hypothetical protein [Desulfallas sp. Bu1-1]MBF7084029.1 hypothetical protein [Desulfallas sp. Bu1-1]
MLNKVCILYKDHLRLTLLVAGGEARKTYIYWFKKPPVEMRDYESFEGKWVEGSVDEPVIMLDNSPYGGEKINLAPYINDIEVIYQVIAVSKSGKLSWKNVTEQEFDEFMKSLDYQL